MLARDVLEYEKINGKDDGNMKTLTAGFASALALSFFGLSLQAETLYWRGTSSELASVAANWSPEQVPTAANDIVLDADSANKPLTWDLDVGVASWTQSDYTGTVTFQTGKNGQGYNGKDTITYVCHGVSNDAGVKEFPISGNLTIASGTWTHTVTPTMSSTSRNADHYKKGYGIYRLVVRVGGNCTIAAAASLNASGLGYADGPGYDAGSCGACHGGFGGGSNKVLSNWNLCYGSIKKPISIGSGRSTRGGGNVCLTVSGCLTLDGEILAEGGKGANYPGSGGSVWITAGSLTGSGRISADSQASTSSASYCGGGGRVAVYVTGESSTFESFSGLLISATIPAGGTTPSTYANASPGTVYLETAADRGAGKLIIAGLSGAQGSDKFSSVRKYSTPIKSGSDTDYDFSVIELSGAVRLGVGSNVVLRASSVTASERASRLISYGGSVEFADGMSLVSGTLGAMCPGATIKIGDGTGAMSCTNTNFAVDYPMSVNGSITAMESSVWEHSQNTDSSAYRFDMSVSGDLTIGKGVSIDLRNLGYSATGPGGPKTTSRGGSHGGVARDSGGDCYGDVFDPISLGSGGTSGLGSGAVRLSVGGVLTFNGEVKGFGSSGNYGGSGGSVSFTSARLVGAGTINVNGANTASDSVYYSGGGGRVALRLTDPTADFSEFTGEVTAYGGKNGANSIRSGGGTIYRATGAQYPYGGVVTVSGSATDGVVALPPLDADMENYKTATFQISSGIARIDSDLSVGDVKLAKNATIALHGHTMTVLSPAASKKKSILGTVDDSEGGSIEWPRKGLVLMVR